MTRYTNEKTTGINKRETITGKSFKTLEKEMRDSYILFLSEERELLKEHLNKKDSFSKLIILFYKKIKKINSRNLKKIYEFYMSIKVIQLVYNTWKNKDYKRNTYSYKDLKELRILPGVFSPKFASDSYLWAKYMASSKVVKNKRVLEMGAGTGIISFYLYKYGQPKQILAGDINKHAIKNMKENKVKMRVPDAFFEIRETNLYSNISKKEKFDVIFWAYVWLKLKDSKMIEILKNEKNAVVSSLLNSIIDPKYNMLRKFLAESRSYLNQHGKILLITTDFMPNEYIKSLANKLGFSLKIKRFSEQQDVVKSAKMVLDLYQIELKLVK